MRRTWQATVKVLSLLVCLINSIQQTHQISLRAEGPFCFTFETQITGNTYQINFKDLMNSNNNAEIRIIGSHAPLRENTFSSKTNKLPEILCDRVTMVRYTRGGYRGILGLQNPPPLPPLLEHNNKTLLQNVHFWTKLI